MALEQVEPRVMARRRNVNFFISLLSSKDIDHVHTSIEFWGVPWSERMVMLLYWMNSRCPEYVRRERGARVVPFSASLDRPTVLFRAALDSLIV